MKADLRIQVSVSNNASYLKDCYFTPPFKVLNITENRKEGPLHLMMMSSSPGILDGDLYQIEIHLDAFASLQLHTQAYQRLFNMKQGASQQLHVHLANNSHFCFLPHPSVPHEQSIFQSENNFYLTSGCRFIFGEVLTCGRKLNGEVFLFSRYHSISKIYLNNKLVIKENLLMEPALINVEAIGQLEGFTHQASLIYLEENVDIAALQQKIKALLVGEAGIAFGVTAAPVNGLILRLMGNGAAQLHGALLSVSTYLQNIEIELV